MSAPNEGLNALCYVSSALPVVAGSVVALLQGVDLSWAQEKVRFFNMGSIALCQVLDGVVTWQGAFRSAHISNLYPNILNIGTTLLYGSICPRGAATPCIVGTLNLTGGNLSNMASQNANAVIEENTFIIYNLTITG